MVYYIILFSSAYITLSAVTAYGFIDSWYWPWLALLLFINIFMLGVAAFFVFCWFLSFFVDVNKPIHRQNQYFYHLLCQAAFLVLRILRVHIRFSGKEYLPKNCRFLLVCNHIAWLDPAVALVHLKKYHLAFISKKENYSYPIAGPFLHKTACLGIDRENDREALKTINKAAELIKDDVCPIGIFPEGWVSKTGELLEFRHGAFRIAKKAECPVIVCKITGSDKIFKKRLFKKCEVHFEIKGVVPLEFVKEHKTFEISKLAREIMTK